MSFNILTKGIEYMTGGSSKRAVQIVNSQKKICNNTKNFFTVPDIFLSFDSISANTAVKKKKKNNVPRIFVYKTDSPPSPKFSKFSSTPLRFG